MQRLVRLPRAESERRIKGKGKRRRVEIDGRYRTQTLASSDGLPSQRPADTLAMMLDIDKQAAEIPELLDQNDTNDRRVELRDEVNATIRIISPELEIMRDVIDRILLMSAIGGCTNDRCHQRQYGSVILGFRCA